MKRIAFTDAQYRVLLAALEAFVAREQAIADEQGLDATADQEAAEDLLDALEEGTSPLAF